MATLRDGLGGEEVAGSGLQAGATNISPYWTGSATSESQFSGLNMFATGSHVGGVIADADGAVKSVIGVTAANTFGMTVLAGSVTTGDTNVGVVDFVGADFANANYFFVCTGRDYTIPGASGLNAMASGTRRASGLEILGPSGTTFDWLAVGQR